MNYGYYELISICEQIATKLDALQLTLDNYLPKLLYIIMFFVFLKIGFTCLRGYKA